MRIFDMSDNRAYPGSEMNMITPAIHRLRLHCLNLKTRHWHLFTSSDGGRGRNKYLRRLEDGVLPILHSTLTDDDVEYRSTAFASLEKSPLAAWTPIGTDWLVADDYSIGHMLTKEQEDLVKPRLVAETNKSETTVLYFRSEAFNRAAVPRYAWFKQYAPSLEHGVRLSIPLTWKPVFRILIRQRFCNLKIERTPFT